MTLVNTAALVSIAEADRMGISGLIRRAEEKGEQIITRHGKPVGALVSVERFERLRQLEEEIDDGVDISLAAARLLTTNARRHSLDDVLTHFGYTRDQLGEYVE